MQTPDKCEGIRLKQKIDPFNSMCGDRDAAEIFRVVRALGTWAVQGASFVVR